MGAGLEHRVKPEDLAAEVRDACLGMRVAHLHRVVSRSYDQELRNVGLSRPQLEVLAQLILAEGPVKPAALAGMLMVERSTLNRNLALMQKHEWIAVTETSATGRAMSVTITDAGREAFTRAGAAWRSAQAEVVKMLGADAASTIDEWLG
jgi:DNA-binding MarR family transcriptional regulator